MKPLAAALASFALAAGVAPAFAHHDPMTKQHVDRTTRGWPVAGFTLVDQKGAPVAREHLLDRWTFVVFGDTACGERCAPALAALTTLSRRIAGTQAIRNTHVLFVSLDPERDTPPRLAAFLAPYDESWVAATGRPDMLARLADELGAAGKAAGSSMILIGPDGTIRAEYLPPYDALQITADYMKTRTCRGCGP